MTEEAAPPEGAAPGQGAPSSGTAAVDAGRRLTLAREAAGLTVADVALQLKFAPRQIEALEAGRFEDLPPGTFARGMAKAYARMLKVDPEALLAEIASRTALPDTANAVGLQRPIPITDSARRMNVIYAGLSVVFLVVIVGVIFEWQREKGKAEEMNFVAPAPVAPAPVLQAPPSDAAAPSAPAAEPAAKPEPQSAAPVPAPAARSSIPAEGGRALRLRFERDAWVQIRGRGGKLLLSELNRAGTERLVEGTPPFDLVIGNAQHVRLSYADRPVDLTPHVKVEVARFTLD